jgi:hypothetical protein
MRNKLDSCLIHKFKEQDFIDLDQIAIGIKLK